MQKGARAFPAFLLLGLICAIAVSTLPASSGAESSAMRLMSGSQLSAAPLVVVSGRSMLPLFYTGDLVVVFKPDPNNVRVGDVIVYRSLFGNLVIHRVIRVVNASPCNPVCFITKGDNNMLDDAMLGLQPRVGVDYGDSFIGKVISVEVKIGVDKVQAPIKIPYLGVFSLLLHGG